MSFKPYPPDYFESFYIYIKVIPSNSKSSFIACIQYYEGNYYLWEFGGLQPLFKIKDCDLMATELVNKMSTYQKFDKFDMSFYKRQEIKLPEKYEYIFKKDCYYDTDEVKTIPWDEVKTKLKGMLIGLKVLEEIFKEN